MSYKYIIGIDVSKDSLDFSITKSGEAISQQVIPNSKKDIRKWITATRKGLGATTTKTLYCMENTGFYSQILIDVLLSQKAAIWVESALQINKSLGIQRGKSDKVDSFRIAQYAYTNQHKIKLYEPKREILVRLKMLNSLKIRLLSVVQQLQVALKGYTGFTKVKMNKELSDMCKKSIKTVKEDLKATLELMQDIIHSDERLEHLYEILTSVPFVGPVTAIELIITTNEFKNFDSPSKFACYSGVAPFEHTSGTSVKGKTKVSHFANKRMKTILHMVAVASISKNGELRSYYDKKVAEGHPKMSVINSIRNKIIHKVFACVRDDIMFIQGYKKSLMVNQQGMLTRNATQKQFSKV